MIDTFSNQDISHCCIHLGNHWINNAIHEGHQSKCMQKSAQQSRKIFIVTFFFLGKITVFRLMSTKSLKVILFFLEYWKGRSAQSLEIDSELIFYSHAFLLKPILIPFDKVTRWVWKLQASPEWKSFLSSISITKKIAHIPVQLDLHEILFRTFYRKISYLLYFHLIGDEGEGGDEDLFYSICQQMYQIYKIIMASF